MAGHPRPRRASARAASRPYLLLSRGPDGRSRIERFARASAYRTRLAALRPADEGLSLSDIVDWLDDQPEHDRS